MADDRPMVNVYEPTVENEYGVMVAAPDAQLVYRPMTDDEYAEWQQLRADNAARRLAMAQVEKTAEVQEALTVSDQWLARCYEDGTVLQDDRKAYRAQLRQLLAEVAAATDPAVVEAVELPDVPAYTA